MPFNSIISSVENIYLTLENRPVNLNMVERMNKIDDFIMGEHRLQVIEFEMKDKKVWWYYTNKKRRDRDFTDIFLKQK